MNRVHLKKVRCWWVWNALLWLVSYGTGLVFSVAHYIGVGLLFHRLGIPFLPLVEYDDYSLRGFFWSIVFVVFLTNPMLYVGEGIRDQLPDFQE